MKFDFQMSMAIVGITLTVFFGVWSIVKGKVKASSRFVKLFLVLLVLIQASFSALNGLVSHFCHLHRLLSHNSRERFTVAEASVQRGVATCFANTSME